MPNMLSSLNNASAVENFENRKVFTNRQSTKPKFKVNLLSDTRPSPLHVLWHMTCIFLSPQLLRHGHYTIPSQHPIFDKTSVLLIFISNVMHFLPKIGMG